MFAILVHVLMHVELQSVVLMQNVLLDSIHMNVYALKIISEIQLQNVIHVRHILDITYVNLLVFAFISFDILVIKHGLCFFL